MFGKAMVASQGAASNLVPRANLDRIASLVPRATLDTLWKARGCHLNTLEGFPLFAAAMVSLVLPKSFRQYLLFRSSGHRF